VLVLLALLFILVPIAELYVIIQVGQSIGALETIGLLVLISLLGAWLAKREGLGVVRRVRLQLEANRVPAAEILDGFLILLAGALLLTPGFLTDIVAILLLLPPTRAGVRAFLRRRLVKRVDIFGVTDRRPQSRPPDLDV
jgi:UPF0716 protein FxsA